MSIATEITRISNAKTALKTAINAKGGSLTNEKIDEFATELASIPTVTQPSPTVSVNASTGLVTGSYTPASGFVTDTTAKSGTLQLSSENVPTLLSGNIKKDVAILGVTGTLEGKSATVTQPAPTISVDSSTGVITASYTPLAGDVSDTTVKSSTQSLTVQSAQTITPTTTDQTIAAGQYLTGTQTIKGDANLIAGNIKKDTTIFNVTGTYEGSGGESAVAGYFTNTDGTITFTPVGGTAESVTDIYIPDTGVAEPDYSGMDEFKGMISHTATSINIPYGTTRIAGSAFYYNTALESITIPSSVTSIGIYAFYYCDSLESVTIPSSVISIGNYAFCDCTALTSVTIPSSVTSIGSSAFSGCTALTTCTLGDGFSCTGLNLEYSTRLTHDSMVAMFAALATVTGTHTLTLGSTNLAKLTSAEIAVATDKGWTIN